MACLANSVIISRVHFNAMQFLHDKYPFSEWVYFPHSFLSQANEQWEVIVTLTVNALPYALIAILPAAKPGKVLRASARKNVIAPDGSISIV